MIVATVSSLTRYPVKSLGGEAVAVAEVGERGLHGDRAWGVYTADGGIGSGKTTRRFRRVDGLLGLGSRLHADGSVDVVLPDGEVLEAGAPSADAALSRLLDRPVTLRRETTVPHHDESPIHLVTASGLAALSAQLGAAVDARRFRANLLLDDAPAGQGAEVGVLAEDAWVGRGLALGAEVVMRVTGLMPRCVMVTMPQRDLEDGGPRPEVLKALAGRADLTFGVTADVVRPGRVAVGDEARLL
ncbi:MAG: MOSC domain-containing protein [Kineosporiaceae bacterium]